MRCPDQHPGPQPTLAGPAHRGGTGVAPGWVAGGQSGRARGLAEGLAARSGEGQWQTLPMKRAEANRRLAHSNQSTSDCSAYAYAVDTLWICRMQCVCSPTMCMRCTCSGPFSRSMTDRARTNSTSPWRAASACVALGSCSARPRSTNRATIVRGRSGSHVALSKARLRRVSSRPVWVLLARGSSLEWHTARRSAAGAEARARARRGRQGSQTQRLLAARWSSRLGKSPSVPGASARRPQARLVTRARGDG